MRRVKVSTNGLAALLAVGWAGGLWAHDFSVPPVAAFLDSKSGERYGLQIPIVWQSVSRSAPPSASPEPDRHAEPGWQKAWTDWLKSAIGGYAVFIEGRRVVGWDGIPMNESFSRAYCPRYNSMAREDKRAFLAEVFKAVSFAESRWDADNVNPTNRAARGLFQMSASDMRSCRRIYGWDRTPNPIFPEYAIPCAVQKLMPVFYWESTFATKEYRIQDLKTGAVLRTQNNHFEVLHPKWGSRPLGVHPALQEKLSDRVTPSAFPSCFGSP